MILSNWLYTQDLLLQTQYHGIEEGLSHRDVQSIYQDDRGLIWVGTKQGLNRFDGYQFKPYTKESHQLQSNKITHILGDKQGNLWLFDTESYFLKSVFSISVFDPVLEVAYSLEQYLPKGLPFAARDIIGFNQNQDRSFVFFTKKNEIFLYDKEFKKIDITLFNFHKLENIHWAPSGLIWLNMRILEADGTSSLQLLAINTEGKIVHDISHPEYHDLFIHKLDKEGNCHYLATKSLQYSKPYILGNDGQIKNDTSISNKPLLVQHLYQDQIINSSTFKREKGYCWIANKGLNIFSQHKKIDSQSHPALEQIKSATCIFFDRQGTVWIGTPFGLYQLQLGKNKFNRLLYKIKESNIPTRNICLDHNDHLWVIEEGTLNLWGIDLKQKINYTINTSETLQNNVIIKNSFNAIITSKDSSLYFVSGDDLIRIHPITLEAQYIPIRKHGQNWTLMWALHEDENNNIWFASENGDIGCWDGENVFWLP
ncbi:MAG: hypothetical protein MI974_01155, partial [Chitinophagales bacterium]|nr:hypothetical protein [Chitinophagales bacterium]